MWKFTDMTLKRQGRSSRVKEIMEQTPGLADIEPSREENYPEVNVTVDREKAALLGITATDVANAVLFSLNGNGQTDPIIYTDPHSGNEYFISAWLAEEHRKSLTDLENILLTTRNGEPVLLKNLASLVERGAGESRSKALSACDSRYGESHQSGIGRCRKGSRIGIRQTSVAGRV